MIHGIDRGLMSSRVIFMTRAFGEMKEISQSLLGDEVLKCSGSICPCYANLADARTAYLSPKLSHAVEL